MRNKIHAQPDQKLKTLRIARPIGDIKKYYGILRNIKKYQKKYHENQMRKYNSCSAGEKIGHCERDVRSGNTNKYYEILRNIKSIENL